MSPANWIYFCFSVLLLAIFFASALVGFVEIGKGILNWIAQ